MSPDPPLPTFAQQLSQATPRVFVTPLLVAINVAVFLLMVLNGVGFLDPKSTDLIRWGADYGPLTTHGQYWRMLTAVFVHIGVIHIVMNMLVLLMSGIFVEKLFGNAGFTVLYLVSGLGGSVASLLWNPSTVAAGASGAVFGVYGGLIGFLLMQRNTIPSETVSSLFKSAGMFLVYNLIYGAAKSHIDMAAHLGGLVTGFVVGCALAQPLTASAASRLARSAVVLVVGVAAVAAATVRIPRVDDPEAAIKHIDIVEASCVQQFNDAVEKLQGGQMTPTEFESTVEQKVLPPWTAERDKLAKLRVRGEWQTIAGKLIQYMTLRGEGWDLVARGAAKNDADLMHQGQAKAKAANEVVNSLK